jgi:hypothetical protein
VSDEEGKIAGLFNQPQTPDITLQNISKTISLKSNTTVFRFEANFFANASLIIPEKIPSFYVNVNTCKK